MTEEPGFYRGLRPDLPGWREVIDEAVRRSAPGGGRGATPQLAFGTEPSDDGHDARSRGSGLAIRRWGKGMNRYLKLGAVAVALTLAAGAAQAEGKLSVYHWFEYIPQELLDKFAAEHGNRCLRPTPRRAPSSRSAARRPGRSTTRSGPG